MKNDTQPIKTDREQCQNNQNSSTYQDKWREASEEQKQWATPERTDAEHEMLRL